MRVVITCLAVIVLASAASAGPINPTIFANDFNFSYSNVSYNSGTHVLTGVGANAVTTIRPSLSGGAYIVQDLSGNPGASLSLNALFDCLATNALVDGLFKSAGTDCDLVITGKIPGLGIAPGGSYTGTLVKARVQELEIYGNPGTTETFNGIFIVTGGDLVVAGLMHLGDGLGMSSPDELQGISPSLPSAFNFGSSFTASAHLGELGTIPEPSTLFLLGTASLLGLGVIRRRALGR